MKVDRKDLFNYLNGSPFRQPQFDVSILAQPHNLLMKPPSPPEPPPTRRQSEKQEACRCKASGDRRYEMKVTKVDAKVRIR